MSAPTLTTAGQDLRGRLDPFAQRDDAYGYALAWWCAAHGAVFDEVDQVVLAHGDVPGWARLFRVDDPVACPAFALPWVCQFAGIDPAGLSEQEMRSAITLPANLLRGTVASLTRVVKATLTGTRVVIVRERYDPAFPSSDKPYHLTIVTRTGQTPNTALTLAAALSQKPAGLILHMLTVDGVSIDEATVGKTINGVTAGVKIDSVVATDL